MSPGADSGDSQTHFINVCGQCLKELGITHVGYSARGPHVKMIMLLVDKCPKICEKCNYFVCDECRDLIENKCPEPCSGNFITYTIF